LSQNSHSQVVRILASSASSAGGPGSNPGGVTCGIEEEWLGKQFVMHGVTNVCKTL